MHKLHAVSLDRLETLRLRQLVQRGSKRASTQSEQTLAGGHLWLVETMRFARSNAASTRRTRATRRPFVNSLGKTKFLNLEIRFFLFDIKFSLF